MKFLFFNRLCDHTPQWLKNYRIKKQKISNHRGLLIWIEINRKLNKCIGEDDLECAIIYARHALREAQRFFGKDHDKTGISHYALGTLYVRTGESLLAQEHLQQAWKIHKNFSSDEGQKLAPATFQTLMDVYSTNKQQDKTECLLLEGIDTWGKTLNQQSDIYYNCIKALRKEFECRGAYAKAEKLLISELKNIGNIYGSEKKIYGYLLGNLGLLYFTWGRPTQAIESLEKSLDILEKLGQFSTREYSSSLSALIHLYTTTGEPARAEKIYNGVLLRVGSAIDPANIDMLMKISQALWEVGEYGKAQPLLEQLVEIYRAETNKDHPDDITLSIVAAVSLGTKKLTSAHRPYIEAMRRLANLHIILGEYQSAAYLYTTIWRMSRTISGLKSLDLALYMMGNKGSALFGKRPYNPAWRTDPDILSYIESLGTAARLFLAIGDLSSHSEVIQSAYSFSQSILGKQHPLYLQSLNAYAQMEISFGKPKAAFEHYRECQETCLTVFGKKGNKSPIFQEAVMGMAGVFEAEGMADQALKQYQKILSTFDQNNPLDTLSIYTINISIARIHANSKNNTEAIGYLLKSVSLFDTLLSHIMAYGYNQRLEEYINYHQSLYHMLFSLFVGNQHELSDFIDGVYGVLLKRKAAIQEWAVQKKIHIERSKDPIQGELFSRLKKLQEDFASQLNRSRFFPLSADMGEYQANESDILKRCAREIRKLEKTLSALLPRYATASGIHQISIENIIPKLPDGYVLIDYVYYKSFEADMEAPGQDKAPFNGRYAAFIVRKDQTRLQVADIGEASYIENLITSLREEITSWGKAWREQKDGVDSMAPATFFTETARSLSQALFAPVLSAISGHKKILVSADGALFEFPFEILPLPGNRYLIEEYDVHYIDAARDLVNFDGATAAQSPPLIVADPDFDLCAGPYPREASPPVCQPQSADGSSFTQRIRNYFDDDWTGFQRLDGAREEGCYVHNLLGPEAILWQGDQALKGKLIQVHSPHILHIATHSFVIPGDRSERDNKKDPWFGQFHSPELKFSEITDNPLLRSGLILAGANTFLRKKPAVPGAEDGILTSVDISAMDMVGTELVVLSACGTGLGEVKPGEGIFGMRRAFVLAGVRSLLVSLWSVPDQETKVLLSWFYNGLDRGLSKTASLKEAKLAMIRDFRKRQEPDHPYTWGAFVCVGDPKPVERFIK